MIRIEARESPPPPGTSFYPSGLELYTPRPFVANVPQAAGRTAAKAVPSPGKALTGAASADEARSNSSSEHAKIFIVAAV